MSVVLALGACARSGRPTAGPPGRDSAGITIIESAAPRWAAGHGRSIADSPTVDLSGIGSPDAALRLGDGRIVVADGRPVGLRYFSRDGHPLYDVGRAGDGPGELRSIYHLDLAAADTVAVYDFAQHTLFLYDPNGALARTIVVAESLTPKGANGYVPKGIAADGRYLLQRDEVAFPFTGAPGSLLIDSTRLFWLSRQGTLTDSTRRLVAGQLFGFELKGAGDRRIVTPLARPLAPALRVITGGGMVWAGDGSTWSIVGYDAHGAATRLLRIPRERLPFTAAQRDSFVTRYRSRIADAAPGSVPAQVAAGIASAPFSDTLPAYNELLAGEDSTLWVQHVGLQGGVAGDAGLIWTVFGADGAWLGEVTMPAQFAPTAVGRDWILGLWRDPAGATHVRLYPLVER
ncbi:MAG: hypothetical protein JF590_00285 [Gemmatimonadetes bacterium]|nr:hypothetical protein [Gemmatimonadota bacterium]